MWRMYLRHTTIRKDGWRLVRMRIAEQGSPALQISA
jgi:hypothetical protein